MPYFKWSGITLDGTVARGTVRLRSQTMIDDYLLKKDIGLLHVTPVARHSRVRPITSSMKASSFYTLATLLDAGVFLDHALLVVKSTTRHALLKEVWEDIHNEVLHGVPLAAAIMQFPTIFDRLTCMLMHAGQQSGSLVSALSMLAAHLQHRALYVKKIQRALMAPTLTILFFLLVIFFVLMILVPLFENLFSSVGQPLPSTTAWLVFFSSLLTAHTFLLIGTATAIVAVAWYSLRSVMPSLCHYFSIARVPVIGTFLLQVDTLYCFEGLALLMRNGTSLMEALHTMNEGGGFYYIGPFLKQVHNHINNGLSLSTAIATSGWPLPEEINILLPIADEAGAWAPILEKAAQLSREMVDKKLFFLTTILQPLLMISLGLLVVGMIVIIYMPIFSLSYNLG